MLKQAGISFFLADSHKISQPKNIMQLSTDLSGWVREQGYDASHYTVTPDGDDFDKLQGTINWYISPKVLDENTQAQLAMGWIKEQKLMDFEINLRGPEISGLSSADEVLKVYRLDIIKNGTAEYLQIPEIHLSNANAYNLLSALNLPQEYSGSVSLSDLRQRLALLTETKMRDFTRDPENEYNDHGDLRYSDPGTPIDQIKGYISALHQIVDFGIANGFHTMVWS